MRECITHHHSCDCREERMRLLEKVAEAARNADTGIDNALKLMDALRELDALGEGE